MSEGPLRYVKHKTEPRAGVLLRDDGDMLAIYETGDGCQGVAWYPAEEWERCGPGEAWDLGAPAMLNLYPRERKW